MAAVFPAAEGQRELGHPSQGTGQMHVGLRMPQHHP